MTDTLPKFSVVVPACARPDQLAQCLDRLKPGYQTFPASDYEIIVTDDSADNSVRELVESKYPWAQWSPGPRRGPAANRNNGAKCARGKWMMFTDDDCLPDPGWIAGFASAMTSKPGLTAWEGPTTAPGPQEYLDETAPLNTNGGYLWSCNMAVRSDVFKSLGGFDERFAYASMEDVDFRERLLASGHAFGFAPDAHVVHPWRVQRDIKPFIRYRKSFYLYLRLHPEVSPRQRGKIHLREAARLLVRVWPSFLMRGRARGSGLLLAKVAVFTSMGLRLAVTGKAPVK